MSELSVRKSQPKEKPYVLKDDGGLMLLVWPSGKKTWRLRYWVEGRERKKTLGDYPLVSLKEARDKRDSVRKALLDGNDFFKKTSSKVEHSFGEYALEWWDGHKKELHNAKNIKTMEHRVKAYIIPAFSGRDCRSITAPEVSDFAKRMGSTGRLETAHRTVDILRQIFRYVIEEHGMESNPVLEMRGVLERRSPEHHPSVVAPEEIALLRDRIRSFKGTITIKNAMLFSLYTFARPGEVRHCEWNEINFDKAEWHIPAEKMKAGEKHIVPLSKQALAALEEMKPLSQLYGRHVFPAPRCCDGGKPYADNAINKALIKGCKYEKRTVSAHGFRSTASTVLNESGLWHWDAIEAQLAHSGGDRVRKAYNYARYLAERREMMQWYADYIDTQTAPKKKEDES